MHADLTRLTHLDDLERLLAESHLRPLLLFKHSAVCGISAEALDELLDHLNSGRAAPALTPEGLASPRYAVVTVQTHREISNAVSARLGIRHETPQALLIHGGRVVWSASHFRVTADAVRQAVSAAAR